MLKFIPFFVSLFLEILGALLSVLSIWVVTGVLVYLAVERIISGNYEIEGDAMLITSGCAVAVNIMYVHNCQFQVYWGIMVFIQRLHITRFYSYGHAG